MKAFMVLENTNDCGTFGVSSDSIFQNTVFIDQIQYNGTLPYCQTML